jgi:hypothetical protein
MGHAPLLALLPPQQSNLGRQRARRFNYPCSYACCLANLDQGTFTEGHELDRKTEKQVPNAMIGRRLSQEEAKKFLAKLE